MVGIEGDRYEHGTFWPRRNVSNPSLNVESCWCYGRENVIAYYPVATGSGARGQAQDQGSHAESDALRIGIPKNKSTGNLLAICPDSSERSRIRMSFDASTAAAADSNFAR